MNKVNSGKEIYDSIKIPAELKEAVQKSIADHPKTQGGNVEEAHHKKPINKMILTAKIFVYAAAAVIVCFTAALNTSEVFAKEVSEIPIIGGIAKVLTIRSYEKKEDNKNITVNIPGVEVEETETPVAKETQENAFKQLQAKEFAGDINAEIEKKMDDYVADAEKRFEEYKTAFLETGGTVEEWNDREINIRADYEVKYQVGSVLSFIISADEDWNSAYGVRYYYNLDLEAGRHLTLEDVLGEDYRQIADQAIVEEMQKRMAEDDSIIYWGYSDESAIDEGFHGVDETTDFYINENGNPVVCFDKYEIAPGAMGTQEFEIPLPGGESKE